ncbi:MAG: hypothetical protein AAFY76_00225 [Cyanobacteria bacterium J06649_11]
MNYFSCLSILLIFSVSCSSGADPVEVPEQVIPIGEPVTVAREFSGNTLTVSATGIPPLAISLVRKDSVVYTDFLASRGEVRINIGPMRSDFGEYEVVVEDATDRDTSMTIRIDEYAPRGGRSSSRSQGSRNTRSKRVTGKFEQLRSEVINHYTRTFIRCADCGVEATLFFPMKGTNWACDQFPDDLYMHQHVAGRETCKKLCGG